MIKRSGLVLFFIFLTSCAAGPDYRAPEDSVAAEFVRADTPVFASGEPEHDWWRLLNDPLLDDLIGQALIANKDLRAANANIRASRALLRLQKFDALPTVTTSGSATRQRTSAAMLPADPGIDTFYDAGFDASWELDFLGRVARSTEATTARYEADIADRHALAVSVTAEVARVYLELRGAQRQLAVAIRNADNQASTLELTEVLQRRGRGTDLDVARAEAQVSTTRATAEALKVDVARAIHRLAVLVGQAPQSLVDSLSVTASLPALPATVAIGDPASLLRRRADIHAAERRLAAATAEIGIASADLFPRVTLTGSAGFTANAAADFGRGTTERWSLGPFLSWPALDLGRVRARIHAADASAEAHLATYEQTVLVALEETENALVAFAQSANREAHLGDAEQASARAVALAQARFRNGLDSFLAVLDAERRLLEAQSLLAQAETENALAFVSVYKALGGGWQQQAAPSI